jgi:hypothetical protein
VLDRSPAAQEYVQVAGDGTPLIEVSDRQTLRPQHLTLQREPYKGSEPSDWLTAAQIASPEVSPLEGPPLILSFSDGQPAPTAWYFVAGSETSSTGFFTGYDFNSRRRVGYLGRNGFQKSEPVADEAFGVKQTKSMHNLFLAPLSWGAARVVVQLSDQARAGKIPGWVCHLVSDDRLIRIDFRKRTVETLFQAKGMASVAIATRPKSDNPAAVRDPQAPQDDYLAVRAQDTLTLLDASGRVQTTYRLPPELHNRMFQFYLAANKAVAMFWNQSAWFESTGENVIEFARDGSVSQKALNVATVRRSSNTLLDKALIGVIVPEPILPLAIVLVVGPLLPMEGRETASYSAAVSKMFAEFWPMLLVTVVLGFLSVWLYRRHAVRFGMRPHPAWMAFVFLAGPLGYVGYRLHRSWPVRIACSFCRAETPRDRFDCISCGKEFPVPEPNGLEIFA